MKYLLTSVLLILICVGACTQAPENPTASDLIPAIKSETKSDSSEISPDVAAVFEKQSLVMKEVKTCQSNLRSKINLKSSDSPGKNVSIVIDINSSIDAPNRQMSSVISSKVSLSGESRNTTQQIMATGGRIYFREAEVTDTVTLWQVKDLDKAAADTLWNQQNEQVTGSRYTEQISPQKFVYSGTEIVNGHTCFGFKQPLDQQMITQIAPELLEQLQTADSYSPDALAGMFKNIELVCLIDEQSYLREIRLKISIDQIVQGNQVSGTIEQYCTFDKFNEPVSIQIPKIS
jgi:hypothetical protein